MSMMNNLLFQRYDFTKPIQIIKEDDKREILSLPEKTIIRTDHTSLENDLAEILATAKLAEQDSLLVNFTFQEHCTSEEAQWISVFQQICQPLRSAWIWKIMRRYVPEEYTIKIENLRNKWDSFYETACPGKVDKPEPIQKSDFLTTATILYENPLNETDFTISSRIAQEEWDAYIDQLKKTSRAEPDRTLYLTLPDTTEVPFAVGIKDENGTSYYVLRML